MADDGTGRSEPGTGAVHAAEERGEERSRFQRFATSASRAAGTGHALGVVAGAAVAWAALGAAVGFTRWWELVASLGLPLVTLGMVVLLQHTQNHDTRATQLKLDELIRASEQATNRMMAVEDASVQDLDRIHHHFSEQSSADRSDRSGGGAVVGPAAGRPGGR